MSIQPGPLRGLFGRYARQAPRDGIRILMDLLGGGREVEVAIAMSSGPNALHPLRSCLSMPSFSRSTASSSSTSII
jgi:hypothetical protein